MLREVARKGAHTLLAGFFFFSAPYIGVGTTVILSCVLLAVFILYRAVIPGKRNIFAARRASYGEFFFIAGVIGSAIIASQNTALFQMSMVVLGLADPLASLFGMHYGKHSYTVFKEKRTVEGSAACFAALCGIFFISSTPILFLILFAAVLTGVEAISPYGSDNFTLPLVTALLYSTII